jgi:hypothetical protein
VTTDHQAVHPARLALRVKCDVARFGKENAEDLPRFNASQRRTNAVMDASTEGHMSPWCLSGQIDGLGVIEHRGIAVGCTPEQENRRPCRNVHATKFGGSSLRASSTNRGISSGV